LIDGSKNMTTQKYTPKQLTDVIFQNAGVEARVNAYANGRLGGNILLYGPNGTGKTSLANLLPNLISGNGAYIVKWTPESGQL
jgi:DNA polymerase III gamma/tau subunit